MSEATQLSLTKQALLARYLRGDMPRIKAQVDVISQRQQGSSAPLSFGQQQMWLLEQIITAPVYNESVTLRIPGQLNVAALEQSINAFIQRHEVWRTTFPLVDAEPIQLIHPELKLPLSEVDLRSYPQAEREPEAIRLATIQARPRFDLTELPLLRATLIHLDDDDHRLFLTLHHIIFDGTIYEVFLPELYTHYEAFLEGKPSPLAPLSIQYADFALWQHERLKGNLLEDQLTYWKNKLANAPTMLQLPTDRPRPAIQNYHGKRLPFFLSKEITNALKIFGQQESVTLYMLLTAAFQILLSRYSGQSDILISTTTAGRNHRDLRPLIGLFLNNLVLRTDLSGNPTIHELLGRVRNTVLDANAHPDIPFQYLVQELQPERNPAWNPLVQVIISLEPPLPVLASGWTITQSDVEIDTAKFDLYLELDDRPEGFAAWLEYNTDLFDEATAQRMIGHWSSILFHMVRDPLQHIVDLPMLTDAEQQQLLFTWNETGIAYAQEHCMHQLFEAQVLRTPTAVAAVFEETSLTYQELNARANQLAHYLRSTGVGPDVLVALCIERSLAMLVALLGILKAGGAYVPLDPLYPAERLTFMLEDAHVARLVTQQSLVAQLPIQDNTQVICMDTDWTKIAQLDETNLTTNVLPDHLAYVIYTSGSTGRPKGVQIPQRALVNFLLSMRQEPGLSADDTLLAVTTLSFDIAGLEMYLPLIVGARLIIASRDIASSGAALAETLARTQTTVMQATPITWRMLLLAGWPGDQQLKVLCGGEALPLELAQQLAPKVAVLYNMYGPTETTIWSTLCKIEADTSVVTIGRPIANTTIYILDQHLQPVPVGMSGELYIGGDGLARGYLHCPELTAERFIEHPFSNKATERIYRTGDLARYRTDGTIEMIGRVDHQIKLRGFRIELGEIESVLEQHLNIKQAVAIVREDKPDDKRLVVYIVSDVKEKLLSRDLRDLLQQHLPEYMLPSAFVFMDTLPLTNNGKIDRKALPAPDREHREEEKNTLVAPTQIAHYQLLTIWEELLSTRPIGIKDNFFYLGGHSLLAARLVARIEQVFEKKLSLSTVFAGPTIEQLVNALQKQQGPADRHRSLMPVQTSGSRPPFFFLHGDWTGGAFYCFTLSHHAGADQPFYALEPLSFEKMQTFPTIEQLATTYLEQIRSIQPEGPYLLGGYCNGGLFAYEIARQLRAANQHVELLALLIPSSPKHFKGLHTLINILGAPMRLKHDQKAHLYLRLRHILRHIYRHIRPQDERVADFAQLVALDARLDGIFPPMTVLYKDYIGVFSQIISTYSPEAGAGKATFIWPEEELYLKKAWSDVISGQQEAEEIVVPGTHMTMVTDHIPTLAQHISMLIKNVHSTRDC